MIRSLALRPLESQHAHFALRDVHGRADYLLREWPDPRCFRRGWNDEHWIEFDPPLLAWRAQREPQVQALRRRSPHGRRPAKDQPRLPFASPESRLRCGGLDEFWDSVPEELRTPVRRLPTGEWPVLQTASLGEATADLVRSNLALAVALTAPDRFVRRRVYERRRVQLELAAKRQHEALGALGFPASRGLRKVLQRIRPEALSVDALVQLQNALKAGGDRLPLGHLPTINAGALALFCDETARAHATPRLFQEVAHCDDELMLARTAHLLRDAIWMLRELGRDATDVRPRSMAQVTELHDEVYRERRLARHGRRERTPRPVEQPARAAVRAERRAPARPEPQAGRQPAPPAPVPVPRPPRRPRPPAGAKPSLPEDIAFGPPPFPNAQGRFGLRTQALRTAEELRAWGRKQRNCVGSYDKQVFAGTYYVYAVLEPEQATLGLHFSSSSGRWSLSQLLGVKNRKVKKGTMLAVRAWLDGR